MMKGFLGVALSMLLLIGCVTTKVDPNAVALDVDFSWDGIKKCSPDSPAIRVSGVPAAAKFLKVVLVDLDVPTWNHGGGKVANDGKGLIPAGALSVGYNGPCPPDGSHRYQFSVKAVNAEGVIIGQGEATRPFPPK